MSERSGQSERRVPLSCPACVSHVEDVATLAHHLVQEAERSDGRHVMWLNRHVSKLRRSPQELEELLEEIFAGAVPSSDRVQR